MSVSNIVAGKVTKGMSVQDIQKLMHDAADNVASHSDEIMKAMGEFAETLVRMSGGSLTEDDLSKLGGAFILNAGLTDDQMLAVSKLVTANMAKGMTIDDVLKLMESAAENVKGGNSDGGIGGGFGGGFGGSFGGEDLDDLFGNLGEGFGDLGDRFNQNDFDAAIKKAKNENLAMYAGIAAGSAFLVGAAAAALFIVKYRAPKAGQQP